MALPLKLVQLRPAMQRLAATSARRARQATNVSPQAQRLASSSSQPKILLEDEDNGFGFIRHNERPPKPRNVGVTEVRGPYYSAMGKRYLSDVFET